MAFLQPFRHVPDEITSFLQCERVGTEFHSSTETTVNSIIYVLPSGVRRHCVRELRKHQQASGKGCPRKSDSLASIERHRKTNFSQAKRR
ncbi:Hypothetical predicted protein [Cloeon dipterum]|uniref:Uncharacterized protein n=1 Tax=Cloeon dipterum TaxID=197152 RepID=A0A8S1DRA5_9INSE|nr:Hypothetical predicted protein [Cloeon dipterum]